MITASMLKALWPRCPQVRIDAIAASALPILRKYGLTSQLRVAHLMAQISHECGAGTIVRENMNYSADRLFEIFGVGHHSAAVTRAEAVQLAHRPEAIAERVYGLGNPKKANELGNTQAGDGYRFRGNGMLQLTGRGAHVRVGKLIKFDLAARPEILEVAGTSLECAIAEFVALDCLGPADADDVRTVTRRVNGGFNGLAERTVWLRKWKAALRAATPLTAPAVASAAPATASNAAIAPTPEEAGADVPPPEEPRGGESDQAAPMTQSTIGNGAVAGGGLTVASIAAMIFEKLKEVPDSLLQALMSAAQSPAFWTVLGVGGACGFIYWRRFLLKRDAGV